MDKLELCDKIYAYIERHDVCRGSYVTSNGAVCLLGAGRLILVGPEESWRDLGLFYMITIDDETVRALGFRDRQEVMDFSDSSTKGEVLEHVGRMANLWLEEKLRSEEVELV